MICGLLQIETFILQTPITIENGGIQTIKEIQGTRCVYYLSVKEKISRVINDFKIPNGIIGTPDGKTLYVADIQDKKYGNITYNQMAL